MNAGKIDLDRFFSASDAEKELLCETWFGRSWAESRPEIEYETLIQKIRSGEWFLCSYEILRSPGSAVAARFSCHDVSSLTRGVSCGGPEPDPRVEITLRPGQGDGRLVDMISDWSTSSAPIRFDTRTAAVNKDALAKAFSEFIRTE